MPRLLLALALAGCAPRATPPAEPIPAASEDPLGPHLAPLAFLVGTWRTNGGTETWTPVGGAIFGVALSDRGDFELMIVDDGDGAGPADGVLRFVAMPGGAPPTEFRAAGPDGSGVTFANPAHDAPKEVRYERAGDGLRATLDPSGDDPVVFAFTRAEPLSAPELEAADRARGGDRAPVASGRAGDVGFTVGRRAGHGYATVWARQPDGSWTVRVEAERAIDGA